MFLRPIRCRVFISIALVAALWSGCAPVGNSKLDAVKKAGVLTVLTYTSPTTYYETPEGPAGFEYDLAQSFADHLGVKLKLIVAKRQNEALARLVNGDADVAAAGLSVNAARHTRARFTTPYQKIRQQVIYRLNDKRPENIAALVGREIEVQAGTMLAQRLADLKSEHPALRWIESNDNTVEELLQMVWQGLLDLTVADSHVVTVNRQYFPELQVAFDLAPDALAWALPVSDDLSLYDEAKRFLAVLCARGQLAQLIDRYYGPASRSNFINVTVFQLRAHGRLPQYQNAFEAAASKYGLDWRLLAAISYQESYWDPRAVSPTGVAGFMMLTRDTAADLGVVDRHDPAASADGAARYVRQLINRLPAHIPEPDRTWFALASYNVGFFHVEDARILTQKQKGDPNRWSDVKDRLPLLSDPKWYGQAKYGFCRGLEPVQFVNRVRVYYDVLTRLDDDERAQKTTHALKLKAPAL